MENKITKRRVKRKIPGTLKTDRDGDNPNEKKGKLIKQNIWNIKTTNKQNNNYTHSKAGTY